MLLRLLLALILMVTLASCSGSSATEEVSSTEGIELVDSDEDLLEVDERTLLEGDSGIDVSSSEIEGIDSIALDDIDNQEVNLVETQPMGDSSYSDGEEYNKQVSVSPDAGYYDSMRSSGDTSTYNVQENETLMLIAFKLYGDYSRWRELASLNQGKLGAGNQVYAGTNIKYYTDGSGFTWNPNGEPYLIKQRDTLSKISNKVYGTFNKWKSIWNNNKPLIKNPDRIFAGFTIYYPTSN